MLRRVGKSRVITKGRINIYLILLKALFNKAIEWEIYNKSNPVRKVKLFKVPPRQRFFSREEIVRLWEAAYEISENGKTKIQCCFMGIFVTALLCGMRLSEILHLRWQDYQDDYFILHKTKNQKKRYVPVRAELLELLNNLPRSDDYVFDLPRRDSDLIANTWKLVKEKAGIEATARFHDLRHTHATLLLQSGVDVRTVQEILGHSSLKMVEAYTHTTNPQKMIAVNKINLSVLKSFPHSDEEN